VKIHTSQGDRPCLPNAVARGVSTCLACFAALTGTSVPALADDATTAALPPTQSVAVTALRVPATVSDTVAEVTVISREDLDKEAGLSLTQLLAREPGIQFASYGGPGQSSSLFIRGLEARHTLLLLDGVPVSSASLGTPSLDNLPVSLIDHIEIVRGPMSSLYGNEAAGGVVQVFTRRGRDGLAYSGDVTAGSRGYQQERVGLGYGHAGLDLELDIQHLGDRGFSATNPSELYGDYNPDRDGFKQNAISGRVGYQFDRDWRVEAVSLASSGQVHYDDGPGADSRAQLVDRVQAVTLTGQATSIWRTTLTASKSTDLYDTQVSASPYTTLGTISSVQQQFSLQNSVVTPIGTVVGVLDSTTQKVNMPDGGFEVSRRQINGAALALDGKAQGLVWQASLRRDHNSQFGNQTTGAAALAYDITPEWRVGASYGTSFNAPSFDQLYYPDYGNPNLQPERGHSTELNTTWTSGVSLLRASLYSSRIRGFITSGTDPTNIALAKVDGLTLAGETRWRALTLKGSIDHIDPRSSTEDAHGYSEMLPRRAKNALKTDATWALDGGSVGAAFTAYSRRYDDAANTLPLGAYALVDLYADRKLTREWSLGARVNNVANKFYETAYGYNQPGREVFVTLHYTPR
jgi:vitamin B12 transporter